MDSYTAYRIIMGFICSTLAIIFGLGVFFTALKNGDVAWNFLAVVGVGVLGEFICYAMYKNRSKKDTKDKIEKDNDNEKK